MRDAIAAKLFVQWENAANAPVPGPKALRRAQHVLDVIAARTASVAGLAADAIHAVMNRLSQALPERTKPLRQENALMKGSGANTD